MKSPRRIYWLTTELIPAKSSGNEPPPDVAPADSTTNIRKAALNRAHEVRKFEIDLYWKRATYFWLLQAAMFTAVGLTWKVDGHGPSPLLAVALAALGTITALAGCLTAEGSKFWQENWEFHIDMLEDEFEGRLHKTSYVGDRGIAWSVSGVNTRLAIFFTLFWLMIFISTVFIANPSWYAYLPKWARTTDYQTIIIILGAIVAALTLLRRRTSLENAYGLSFVDAVPLLEGSDRIDEAKLPRASDLAKRKKPFLIRRQPKT